MPALHFGEIASPFSSFFQCLPSALGESEAALCCGCVFDGMNVFFFRGKKALFLRNYRKIRKFDHQQSKLS